MDSKIVLLCLLLICAVLLFAFFNSYCFASPSANSAFSGLQVMAVPFGESGGEASYSIAFPVCCYLLFLAMIILLVLISVLCKGILRSRRRSRGKGK